MRYRLIAAVLAFALLLTTGCSKNEETPPPAEPAPPAASETVDTNVSPAPAEDTCSLTMGWDPWEPYHYADIDGEVKGLDVDLVSAIADDAGCTVSFVEGDWATLLNRLRAGEIDMLTGATRTERREAFAMFSDPYREESFALFIRQADAGKYGADNLKKLLDGSFRVGVTSEYIYGEEVTNLQDDPAYAEKFSGAEFGDVNWSRLISSEIDGFLEDPFVAAAVIRKRGLGDDVTRHALNFHNNDVHLMFSRRSVDKDTVAELNASLAGLKASGAYNEILERYLN